MDERMLPGYLQHDIKELKHALATNSNYIRDWACEVQGSINMAEANGEITSDMATYLYKKYLNR